MNYDLLKQGFTTQPTLLRLKETKSSVKIHSIQGHKWGTLNARILGVVVRKLPQRKELVRRAPKSITHA